MSAPQNAIPWHAGLGAIADRHDLALCDIWGVLHDGRAAFAPAVEALQRFRAKGGAVVLITNAPRPSAPIAAQLAHFGVPADAYDDIVTSGDVTIALMAARIDLPMFHIGPARDKSLFAALAGHAGRAPDLVGADAARLIVCTGLFDDFTETPADYEERLRDMAGRGLAMICANPDIVVHRGEELIYCAGALARRYAELGGEVGYAGKPYAPIYDEALRLGFARRGAAVERPRILAIGDGVRTDLAGAAGYGLPMLFIAEGIHHGDLRAGDESAQAALDKLCAAEKLWPDAAMARLRW